MRVLGTCRALGRIVDTGPTWRMDMAPRHTGMQSRILQTQRAARLSPAVSARAQNPCHLSSAGPLAHTALLDPFHDIRESDVKITPGPDRVPN